jgi:hypothetical protein
MDPTPPSTSAPKDDASQAPPEGADATPTDAVDGAEKKKKPVDEKKRTRDRLAARLRRQAQAVKSAKSVEELQALEASLGAAGEAPKGANDLVKAPVAEVLEPGQLPGWPKPSEVDAQRPVALMLWGQAEQMLGATRYAECFKPQAAAFEVQDGKPVITKWQDPKATLADASAPLLAQWMGKVSAISPATAALVAVAGVFGRRP